MLIDADGSVILVPIVRRRVFALPLGDESNLTWPAVGGIFLLVHPSIVQGLRTKREFFLRNHT